MSSDGVECSNALHVTVFWAVLEKYIELQKMAVFGRMLNSRTSSAPTSSKGGKYFTRIVPEVLANIQSLVRSLQRTEEQEQKQEQAIELLHTKWGRNSALHEVTSSTRSLGRVFAG